MKSGRLITNKTVDWSKREVRQEFYQSQPWRELRAFILSEEPFCRRCKVENYLVPAEVVDHIIDIADDPSKKLDINNLQPLCKKCHSSKTLSKMNKLENKPNINREKKRTFKIYNKKWKL